MGRHRRDHRRYGGNACDSAAGGAACANGGRCVRVRVRGAAGRDSAVCACAEPWGGARCQRYVGHDHDCAALACAPTHLCAWRHGPNGEEPGTPYCAVESVASDVPTGAAGGGAGGAGAGAWAGAALALLALLAAVLAALSLLHRRRRGAFVHARLADNVEINNPMYLAGEDEPEHNHNPHHHHQHHANGGNHFANPVYESMYAPQQNHPVEEHVNLMSEGSADGSPAPAERAALL